MQHEQRLGDSTRSELQCFNHMIRFMVVGVADLCRQLTGPLLLSFIAKNDPKFRGLLVGGLGDYGFGLYPFYFVFYTKFNKVY